MDMVRIFILPRLIYGLDNLNLQPKDVETLEKFYRDCLRRIQHLPESTAVPVIYLLIGAIPVEAILDIRKLCTFASAMRREDSLESSILERKLALKSLESHSWATSIRLMLNKYDLPSAYSLLNAPPTKKQWKHTVNRNCLLYTSPSPRDS